MDDLGEPTSYLVVDKGIPVYSSDGEKLGSVVRVLSAREADMFDGIVFDTTSGPGGHRFVDAPEVASLYERGVVLKIDAAEAASLPKPSANPGSVSVNPADLVGGGGRGFMSRMRGLFSGRR
jgi:hypothetical protein